MRSVHLGKVRAAADEEDVIDPTSHPSAVVLEERSLCSRELHDRSDRSPRVELKITSLPLLKETDPDPTSHPRAVVVDEEVCDPAFSSWDL